MSIKFLLTFLGAVFVLLTQQSCTHKSSSEDGDMVGRSLTSAEYDTSATQRWRRGKDSLMASAQSPLPKSVRGGFKGLEYFPLQPEFAFRVHLQRIADPVPVRILASKGDVRAMRKFGRFSVRIQDQVCTITAYQSEESPSELFIPFRDQTNGVETYSGGRYLDLPILPPDSSYVLDFNLAYSPYCAYSEEYSCPIVPADNTLRVPVQAGEKVMAGVH